MTLPKEYNSHREFVLSLMAGAIIVHFEDDKAAELDKLSAEGYLEFIPATGSYRVTESGQKEAVRVRDEVRARNGRTTEGETNVRS